MVVKKKTGKWRVCVDFTDLNKACPKDPFPMLRINQLVDATVGHPRISFLDAFQGYDQIPLAMDDQEKTASVTPAGAVEPQPGRISSGRPLWSPYPGLHISNHRLAHRAVTMRFLIAITHFLYWPRHQSMVCAELPQLGIA